MTIQIQGHVEQVKRAHSGKLGVTVCFSTADCALSEWTFYIDPKDAAHWTPGRLVSATLYAFDASDKTLKEKAHG
jgi:hypothetical protein